jgi:hypothetical protein
VKPSDPDAVHRRFLELVIRATARAAREDREHLDRLRPARPERRRTPPAWSRPGARRTRVEA